MSAYSMMAFGPFAFGLPTAAYNELRRQMQFKHGAAVRVGERDAYQFLGQGEEMVTLTGTVAPEISGTLASITQLETMGSKGMAYVLVDGAGYLYGVYCIDSIETTQKYHLGDGTPRRVDFSLSLRRTDNLPTDEPADSGDSNNQGSAR